MVRNSIELKGKTPIIFSITNFQGNIIPFYNIYNKTTLIWWSPAPLVEYDNFQKFWWSKTKENSEKFI